MNGGMEAVYDDVPEPIRFIIAPVVMTCGAMFGAVARSHQASVGEPVLLESDLYEGQHALFATGSSTARAG